MLTLILGPSGSGKSVRLREELRQRARSRQRSILIVPEQFTSSTEGALYHALGDELSAYVESYSFTSLAETLLRRYGGAAVPTLSEAGRAVLVRRAMDEMMDKVVYYSRQRRCVLPEGGGNRQRAEKRGHPPGDPGRLCQRPRCGQR